MTTIADVLEVKPVTELDLSRFVSIPIAATVSETVQAMTAAGVTCAFIVDDGILAGLFTQRDVLMTAMGDSDLCEAPIADRMTANVHTMQDVQCVGDGLHIMNELWVRSVPVLNSDGQIVGNFSIYPLMKLIAQLLGERILRTPNEVSVQHGMMFVDFTGINYSQPVTVQGANTIADAVHQMKSRAIGSVVVVDDRDHVEGVLTEFDLQTKVACRGADLEAMLVRDAMTPNPVTLSVRSSIGEGLAQMAEHGFSHVPLLGESGRLVGVTSFRDVADYFETSLGVLQ